MKFDYLSPTDDVRRRQLERVANVLPRLGVPRTYRGFEATIAAVWLVLEDEDCLRMVTTRIYAKVAQLSGQTRYAAERNIRTVVKRAWDCNPAYLSEIAGYPISTQSIPSEFIDMLATDAMRFTSQGQIPT